MVKLFVFLSIGLEVEWIFMFILFVIILVSVVFFKFGGLKIKRWFKVLFCNLVVWIKIFICFCIEGCLI